jgi:hypothetical protein
MLNCPLKVSFTASILTSIYPICAGDIRTGNVGQVIGVELHPDTVEYLVYRVNDWHSKVLEERIKQEPNLPKKGVPGFGEDTPVLPV